MKLDALQAADPKRDKTVLVFERSEATLYRSAAPVEVAEPLRVSRDAREKPTADTRHGQLPTASATKRDDRFTSPCFALGVDAVVVVALVHRARLDVEPANAEGIQQRGDEQGC